MMSSTEIDCALNVVYFSNKFKTKYLITSPKREFGSLSSFIERRKLFPMHFKFDVMNEIKTIGYKSGECTGNRRLIRNCVPLNNKFIDSLCGSWHCFNQECYRRL